MIITKIDIYRAPTLCQALFCEMCSTIIPNLQVRILRGIKLTEGFRERPWMAQVGSRARTGTQAVHTRS